MNWESLNERPADDEPIAAAQSLTSQYAVANLVHYQRRGGQAVELAGAVETGEILFIDDSTPILEMPAPCRHVASPRRGPTADVHYIGPE